MTIRELIKQLEAICAHGASDQAIVKSWCPDNQMWLPVTGFTYDDSELKFYNDED